MTTRELARGALLALALCCGACALHRPAVDALLAGEAGDPGAHDAEGAPAAAAEPGAGFDAEAAAAREAAIAAPDDAQAQLEAALALFRAADLRLQRAAIARVRAQAPDTGEALLALEDRLERELAAEVGALCHEGRAFAARARELGRDDAATRHALAVNAVLGLQADGPSRALFRVGGAVDAMERTIELDPTWDGGAPLLLLGRFRDRAPWPHQDREEAVRLLERAAELCPAPSRLLFLGDALFGLGDRFEEALASWRAAAAAPDSPHDPLAELFRERARARLEREGRWLEDAARRGPARGARMRRSA